MALISIFYTIRQENLQNEKCFFFTLLKSRLNHLAGAKDRNQSFKVKEMNKHYITFPISLVFHKYVQYNLLNLLLARVNYLCSN